MTKTTTDTREYAPRSPGWFRACRARLGWTQRQAALYLGLDKNTVYRKEAGTIAITARDESALLSLLQAEKLEAPTVRRSEP